MTLMIDNPGGLARLRMVVGPYGQIPADPRLHEELLVIDSAPLVRVQATECPTCPCLLQAGLGAAAPSELAAIQSVTCEQWRSGAPRYIHNLNAIFRLFPRGTYQLSLEELVPTDGEGNCFWTYSADPTLKSALCGWPTTQHFSFLVPTQSTAKFNSKAWERSLANCSTHPILTVAMSGAMVAVLDGHHRALAAAKQGAFVPGLVIRPQWPNCWWQQVDASTMESLLASASAVPQAALPAELTARDSYAKYLTLKGAIAFEMFAGKSEDISDQTIDEVISGTFDYERLHALWHVATTALEALLMALTERSDPRAIDIAIRLLKSHQTENVWALAVTFLSRQPSEAVDDLFVSFLCRPYETTPPSVEALIDVYFRRRGQSH